MTVVLAIAAAVGLVLAGLAASTWMFIGWLGAWRLNRPLSSRPEANFTFTPWELGVEFERVEFDTPDGITLRGWFLPRPESRRVIIAMHGYRGNKAQILGISSHLWRSGFNVFLFDFRGRGESDRAPISMGFWETRDLSAALDALSARLSGASVGLLGYSMGGAVALLGGHDPRVAAIVADSVYPSQRAVMEHIAVSDARRLFGRWLDGRIFLPAVEWWHRRLGKPAFDDIAPVAALAKLRDVPLLLISGSADPVVPPALTERLIAGSPETHEAWLVNGAHHCGAYFVDRHVYCARVAAFFHRHLPRQGSSAGQGWREHRG